MKDFYTTCEIAKFCGVSRITVKNWLEKDILPYFRTSGGHRRVKRKDLLNYFNKKNYPLEQFNLFEEEIESKKKILYCWEYYSKYFTENHSNKCSKCLVYKTSTLKCFELVNAIGRDKVNCDHECNNCDYEKKYKSRLIKKNVV